MADQPVSTPPARERPSKKKLAAGSSSAGSACSSSSSSCRTGAITRIPPVTQAAVFHSADGEPDRHRLVRRLSHQPDEVAVVHERRARLVARHERRERAAATNLNLSEWNKPQPPLDEIVEKIQSGEMPPLKYKVMPNHSKARLSSKQKKELIAGFTQLYATQPPTAIRGGGGG